MCKDKFGLGGHHVQDKLSAAHLGKNCPLAPRVTFPRTGYGAIGTDDHRRTYCDLRLHRLHELHVGGDNNAITVGPSSNHQVLGMDGS